MASSTTTICSISLNLHQCVESGDLDSTRNLIESDINLIDTIDDVYGRTPLIICSFKKNDSYFKIAEYLIECGCKFFF
jgi:ankyrin repeat protein